MSNGPFLPVSWSIHTKKVKAIKSSRNNLPPLEKTVTRKKKPCDAALLHFHEVRAIKSSRKSLCVLALLHLHIQEKRNNVPMTWVTCQTPPWFGVLVKDPYPWVKSSEFQSPRWCCIITSTCTGKKKMGF